MKVQNELKEFGEYSDFVITSVSVLMTPVPMGTLERLIWITTDAYCTHSYNPRPNF